MFSRPYTLESDNVCYGSRLGEYIALGYTAVLPGIFASVDVHIGQHLPYISEGDKEVLDYKKVIDKVDATFAREWPGLKEPPKANALSIIRFCIARQHQDKVKNMDPYNHPLRTELAASWVIVDPKAEPVAFLPPYRFEEEELVDIWPLHARSHPDNVALEVITSWRGGNLPEARVALSSLERIVKVAVVPQAA